jgi:hypothetical protein
MNEWGEWTSRGQDMSLGPDLSKCVADLDRLVAAIRKHRDQTDDARCFADDIDLYRTLHDVTGLDRDRVEDIDLASRPTEELLKSCERYWAQRKDPNRVRPGMTIEQLEERVAQLENERDALTRRLVEDVESGMTAELSFNWDRERHSQTPLFLVDMSLLGMKINHLTEYAPYVYFSGEVPIDRVEAIRQLVGIRDLKISKVDGKATREQREAMMAGQPKPGKIEEV